jgi:hypothetical protein
MIQRRSESFATFEIPAVLLKEAERIAQQQDWTIAEAVTYLVSRGVDAQHATERTVARAYDAFMNASDLDREQAGKDLLRSVFGSNSVA